MSRAILQMKTMLETKIIIPMALLFAAAGCSSPSRQLTPQELAGQQVDAAKAKERESEKAAEFLRWSFLEIGMPVAQVARLLGIASFGFMSVEKIQAVVGVATVETSAYTIQFTAGKLTYWKLK